MLCEIIWTVDSTHKSWPSQFVPKQNEYDHQDKFHKHLCESATAPTGHLHKIGKFGAQRTLLLIDKKTGLNQ
jgi:hypothetical protein